VREKVRGERRESIMWICDVGFVFCYNTFIESSKVQRFKSLDVRREKGSKVQRFKDLK
jgi:hypothetical protein